MPEELKNGYYSEIYQKIFQFHRKYSGHITDKDKQDMMWILSNIDNNRFEYDLYLAVVNEIGRRKAKERSA